MVVLIVLCLGVNFCAVDAVIIFKFNLCNSGHLLGK